MSGRKESILKNQSIKNKFPCPNTPLPFCGGLEGRRNLSNISIKKAQLSQKEKDRGKAKNKENFKSKSLKGKTN